MLEVPAAAPPPLPERIPQDEAIFRMQQELHRALQKPVAERNWTMVIDNRKCVGCSTCTVACKAENKLPPGVVYRPVMEEEYGKFPNVARRFLPRPCMHCTHPPCTKVCPVSATWRSKDGVVVIDYEKCIGCRYCISACPYGARTFDWGEYYTDGTPQREKYETEPSFEYVKEWPRAKGRSPVNNTRKCHFCLHRLVNGMLPMCVTSCIGRATYFGDRNDPESLVSELIGNSRLMRLKEELGTAPSVYYLV
ncbi:MAG: 4Fe-4S dicluster domain-containing protein [Clostridia bacterium]|nr:4Fe-4S dicluster domain-containing protein [Clostridia bacterium]